MSRKIYGSWLLVLALSLLSFSCKDEKDGPMDSGNLAGKITGIWLLSSSDAENWVSYEFTESGRINVELTKNGYRHTGGGWYSVDESKAAVTGSYVTERDETFYVDWIIGRTRAFQVDFKLYDNNTYLGESSIYRVLSVRQVEAGSVMTPDYRGMCGSAGVSGHASLDSDIAVVDETTGAIKGVAVGTTFVTFHTADGTAALKVEVVDKAKTFAEQIVGTWVYDVVAEKSWERYTFGENGFMTVSWKSSGGGMELDESAQAAYSVDGEDVSFVVSISGIQMGIRLETETINDFNWTYKAFEGNHANGRYTVQKVLESITVEPGCVRTPDYRQLVNGYEITGYSSHDTSVARVDPVSGAITAVSKGRTYVDVQTTNGAGVVEVIIEGGAIPYDFQDCLGQPVERVREMLGTPDYEDDTLLVYNNITGTVDMVGASLDKMTGMVKGVTVSYNSSVDVAEVTKALDASFIPFKSQTTSTFKAYMDTDDRADATIGVTWDIPSRTLTYVNLATDLFTDYSSLIGLTRSQVIGKMGREPDSANDQSQSFFFFDNKGIAIVSAYYTDFVSNFDNVRSVAVMFDDTLSTEQITGYLKKKYHYYPEYSTVDDLVFVSDGHAMEIYYTPKDKLIMYFPVSDISAAVTELAAAARLRKSARSGRR